MIYLGSRPYPWSVSHAPTITDLRQTIPVDVFELARRYGIEIRTRFLPDRLGAVLHRFGDKSYMYLNASHSTERQRFTVAHELAHRLTNPALARDERFIDSLAADILMPKSEVRWMLRENVPLEQMAKRFMVSTEAMRVRVEEVMKEERQRAAQMRARKALMA